MPPAKALVLFLLLIDCSDSKVLIIIYEDYERCVEPEEEAGKLDFSDLHIIALSDTKVYLNGSVKFLKDINAPWRIFAFGERFIRNKWLMDSIHRKVSDLCQSIQSPLEPWYFITSKFEHKNCPFPAGTVLNFNMQSLTDFPMILPRSLVGNWRFTVEGIFPEEGGKKECRRLYYDLVED